jgi:hypothetical protein
MSVAFARALADLLHSEGAHVERSAALDGMDRGLTGVRSARGAAARRPGNVVARRRPPR